MWFTVEYLRDPADPKSQCWALMPIALDLEAMRTIARDGLAHARDHLGARGFRILNNVGAVVAEEIWDNQMGTVRLAAGSSAGWDVSPPTASRL